jgi:hypothetical protein
VSPFWFVGEEHHERGEQQQDHPYRDAPWLARRLAVRCHAEAHRDDAHLEEGADGLEDPVGRVADQEQHDTKCIRDRHRCGERQLIGVRMLDRGTIGGANRRCGCQHNTGQP